MPSVIRGSDNFDTAGGNAVKAWVNFNGTGTVAIRAAFNVSSITDNGTGDYTVNFTNALADANYSVTGSGCRSDRLQPEIFGPISTLSTSSARVALKNDGGVFIDGPEMSVAIFR